MKSVEQSPSTFGTRSEERGIGVCVIPKPRVFTSGARDLARSVAEQFARSAPPTSMFIRHRQNKTPHATTRQETHARSLAPPEKRLRSG